MGFPGGANGEELDSVPLMWGSEVSLNSYCQVEICPGKAYRARVQ